MHIHGQGIDEDCSTITGKGHAQSERKGKRTRMTSRGPEARKRQVPATKPYTPAQKGRGICGWGRLLTERTWRKDGKRPHNDCVTMEGRICRRQVEEAMIDDGEGQATGIVKEGRIRKGE